MYLSVVCCLLFAMNAPRDACVKNVLARWVKFVGKGKSKEIDSESLKRNLETHRQYFYTVSNGQVALNHSFITGNGVGWSVKNGNFLFDGIDRGCPFFRSDKTATSFPLMSETGRFGFYHAHVLPALIINQFLKVTTVLARGTIETHVLCQGNGYASSYKWWELSDADITRKKITWAGLIVKWLLSSLAFQAKLRVMGNKIFNSGVKVKRLCVWLMKPLHVFMIVWEVSLLGDDRGVSSVCYHIDNLEKNDVRDEILQIFVVKINRIVTEFTTSKQPDNDRVIRPVHVPIVPDMMCVSFMARSTVYLSMIHSTAMAPTVILFHKAIGLENERATYNSFNNKLIEFIQMCVRDGSMVWISPICAAFVDIQDIHLVKVSRGNENSRHDHYVYAGARRGFVPLGDTDSVDIEDEMQCTISSRFPATTLLAHVRACRAVVEQGIKIMDF